MSSAEDPPLKFSYEPVADLNASLRQQLQGFPREPHLWVYALRAAAVGILRIWFRLYHRLEIHGRENLPLGKSFVLVANHQSHLDALCLSAAVPLRHLHRVFPAAAADYFFRGIARSAFASVVINALPFDRAKKGAESLSLCRHLLDTPGNILVLFPEGTRSTDGNLGRFRSGIGRLVEGTAFPVVPCYLDGAYRAYPKGAAWPKPRKLSLHIGSPRSYQNRGTGREAVQAICADLQACVAQLQPGSAERGVPPES